MTIKDPSIYPYQIEIDSNNHTVTKITDRLDKENNPIFEIIGYYNNIPNALKKIAKIKVLDNNKDSALMIRDYASQLEETIKLINVNLNK